MIICFQNICEASSLEFGGERNPWIITGFGRSIDVYLKGSCHISTLHDLYQRVLTCLTHIIHELIESLTSLQIILRCPCVMPGTEHVRLKSDVVRPNDCQCACTIFIAIMNVQDNHLQSCTAELASLSSDSTMPVYNDNVVYTLL